MNIDFHFINESNKMSFKKPANTNAVYFSDLNEAWYMPDSLRTFSIKLVLDGCIHYEVNRPSLNVTPGYFLLASHQPEVKAYSKGAVRAICIDISSESIAEVYTILTENNEYNLEEYQAGYFEHPVFNDGIYSFHENNLGNALQLLVKEAITDNNDFPKISNETFLELLEKIILLEKDNRVSTNGLRSVKLSTKKEIFLRLRRGKSYIDDNFLKNPQILEIAKECNMSEFHFYRCFKQLFGTTPYNYILSKRLSYSKELLSMNFPVNKVAFLCGFPDSSTYTKAFTKYYSKSPSKFFSQKYCRFEKSY